MKRISTIIYFILIILVIFALWKNSIPLLFILAIVSLVTYLAQTLYTVITGRKLDAKDHKDMFGQ